jgi:steroid delta-isomerase-like uncharacterized protein
MTDATTAERGEANKAMITKTIDAVWNRGDWSQAPETYHEDIVVHSPTEPDPLVGREDGWKRLWDQLHTAYPDFRMDIEDMFAEGDKVSVRFRVTGTNTGEYFGMKPTRKPIDVTELAVFHFRDGKVSHIWFGMDTMEIGRQLGVVPPGPPPAALIAFMRFTQRVGALFKRKS